MPHKQRMRRAVAAATVVAAIGLAVAGAFARLVPAASGDPGGSGCPFYIDSMQPGHALELTSATTGGVATAVLSDAHLVECFSFGESLGYRRVPTQIALVQRPGGPSGVETIDVDVSSLVCGDENDLCLPVSVTVGTTAQPTSGCPVSLDFPHSQPADTVAATTFTLDDDLVATVQATNVVHTCGSVYLFYEVVQQRRKLRAGDTLVTIGRSVEGIVCLRDEFNGAISSCKRFNPAP